MMSRTVMVLAATLVSGWIASGFVTADEPKVSAAVELIIETDEGDPQVRNAIATSQGAVIVMAEAGKDGQIRIIQGAPGGRVIAAAGDRQPISLAVSVDEDAENRGWLGVTLGGVSDEMKETAGDIEGLSVLNIAKGSAAEEAGFLPKDVITEINDVAIGNDLGELVSQIADAGPGARVKFTVVRDGERRNLVATLGSRSEMGNLEWIPGITPEIHMSNNVQFRMLEPGDTQGMWVLKGVDDAELEDIPEHLREMLRTVENHTFDVLATENGVKIRTSVVVDGETVTVEREGDGPITVTRIDADGNETVDEYADEDELAEGDEEAYKAFPRNSHGISAYSAWGGVGPDFSALRVDGIGDIHRRMAEIKVQLDGESGVLQEMLEKLHNVDVQRMDNESMAARNALHAANNARIHIAHLQKAHRTIRENADGSIEVVVRKGGDELVTVYSDAADLEARNADAFEKYQELQESE